MCPLESLKSRNPTVDERLLILAKYLQTGVVDVVTVYLLSRKLSSKGKHSLVAERLVNETCQLSNYLPRCLALQGASCVKLETAPISSALASSQGVEFSVLRSNRG